MGRLQTKDPVDSDEKLVWLNNTARYLYNTQKINLSFQNMRIIEHEILEIENSADGFPILYQVSQFPHISCMCLNIRCRFRRPFGEF